MKIALVHDYLTQSSGAERVFELLCQQFPNADIVTSIYNPKKTIDSGDREVKTTRLQKFSSSSKNFRLLAPLYLPTFRDLNLQDYDLIISSCSSFAKAVRKKTEAKHICFCHNINPFLWNNPNYRRKSYQETVLYIVNSRIVAKRIEKLSGKKALVINYPVDKKKIIFSEKKYDYYFVSSRLMSYKRIDAIIEAFNGLGWPLLIAGDGPELEALKAKASDNIKFLGYVSDLRRSYYMANARAVIVPGLEDYGLVSVEANLSGTPVIAFGAGGVLDTQIPGLTSVFFQRQTPEAIHRALLEASSIAWNYYTIREHALRNYTEEIFFKQIDNLMADYCFK